MIKAVLWDNDGTLINSEEVFSKIGISVYKKFGVIIDPKLYLKHIGLPLDEIIAQVHEELVIKLPPEKMAQEIRRNYELVSARDIPLNPYVKQVLSTLKKKYKMAIVTNALSYWVEDILKHHKLRTFFEGVVARDKVPHHKPHPDPYIAVLKLLDIKAHEAIAIEDSPTGFLSVKEAHIKLIAYKSPFNAHVNFSLADYIIEDLREIPKIITNLNKN